MTTNVNTRPAPAPGVQAASSTHVGGNHDRPAAQPGSVSSTSHSEGTAQRRVRAITSSLLAVTSMALVVGALGAAAVGRRVAAPKDRRGGRSKSGYRRAAVVVVRPSRR